MIKNIVFDFGGVIVDIDREEMFRHLSNWLMDADSRLDKYHQTGIFQELEEGKLALMNLENNWGIYVADHWRWRETQTGMAGLFQWSESK